MKRTIPELRNVAAGILLASSAMTLDKCDQGIEALVLVFVIIVVVAVLLLIVQLVLFGYVVHYLVRNKNQPTAKSRSRGIVVGSASSLLSVLGLTSGMLGFDTHSAAQMLGTVVGVAVLAISIACVVVSAQAKPIEPDASPGGADLPAWPGGPQATGPAGPQAPDPAQWPGQQPPTTPAGAAEPAGPVADPSSTDD